MSDDDERKRGTIASALLEGLRDVGAEALSGAVTGAIGAGAAGVEAMPLGAVLGALGGTVVGSTSVARRALAPKNDERRIAGLPVLEERVAWLEDLSAELRYRFEARRNARVADVGRTLLRLVAGGHAGVDEFDGDQRDALIEAMRVSLEALCDDAVPMIARLSIRPVDHFFRGTCRVLVDLDAAELAQFVALIAGAARVIPERLAPVPMDGPHDEALDGIGPVGYARAQINEARAAATTLDLRRGTNAAGRSTAEWVFPQARGANGGEIESGAALLRLLTTHRLADEVAGTTSPTHWILRMRIDTLLDLHFVLSDERIRDPRAK